MKIISPVCNNPIFIEIQYYTLKKYFLGNFEYIIFNDAKNFKDKTNNNDETMRQQIIDICKKLNILCINIPNEHHKYTTCISTRSSESMNHILQFQKKYPDKYLILDSDMFLIDYFDSKKYDNYDCSIVLQKRQINENPIYYFWNGLCYMNMNKIQNVDLMDWGTPQNYDTGTLMTNWLSTQIHNDNIISPEDIRWKHDKSFSINKIYFIRHLWSTTWNENEIPQNLLKNNKLLEFLKQDIRNTNSLFYCELYDDVFLHYRGGSNWNHIDFNNYKTSTHKLYDIFL